uniref:Uncharacterized protein n=1 Tax=Schistocephalus solidus TaxID=70667 RepID=A0A0X3PJ65_SCHSO
MSFIANVSVKYNLNHHLQKKERASTPFKGPSQVENEDRNSPSSRPRRKFQQGEIFPCHNPNNIISQNATSRLNSNAKLKTHPNHKLKINTNLTKINDRAPGKNNNKALKVI